MKKLKSFLLTVITILFSISCEIGLGASVDTEAPSLEISNPPSDAIIREDFAISGTWHDDGSISGINVEFVRLDNKSKTVFEGSYSTNGETDKENGTWSIPINPVDNGLLDGTYEALVAITDNGGHKTTMARTFTIDNTPPVMILQKPSTTIADAADRFDTFGQIFSIVGQAADDNSVEKIDVSVYSSPDCSESSFIKKVTLNNVPPTIDLNVAVFEENVNNDYSAIYGHNTKGNGAVPRYFKLEAYDSSKKYLPDGSVDDTGNVQTSYYLYKDISDLITEYKATGLYKIQSGTYSGNAARTISVDTAKTQLNSKYNEVGKFKLNPDNSPTFVVSARSPLAANSVLTEAAYQLTSGNNYIEIQVDPGLDNKPIDEDSVGLYLYKCDEYGVTYPTTPENQPICLFAPKTVANPNAHDSSKVVISVSGDSYKFKTANVISSLSYPGLEVGANYRIVVVGNDKNGDEKGSDIVADSNSIYGFNLVSSGNFIELITKAEPDYVTSNPPENETAKGTEKNSLKITLQYRGSASYYVIYEDGQIVKDENNQPIIITSEPCSNVVKGNTSTTVTTKDITTTITKDRTAIGAYKSSGKDSITYKIKGVNGYNNDISIFNQTDVAASSEKSVTFIIDDESPQIEDTSIKVGTESYVSSKYHDNLYLNISGEFTEAHPDTVYYYVKTPDSTVNIDDVTRLDQLAGHSEISRFENNKFELKGVEFADNTSNGANTLCVQLMDKAGNLSAVKKYTFNIDTSAPELKAYWSRIGSGAFNNAAETIYVKEGADLYIYGKYNDAQSGVDVLTLPEGFPAGAEVKYSTTEIEAPNAAASNYSTVSGIAEEDWKAHSVLNKKDIKSWRLKYTPTASGTAAITGKSGAGKEVTVNAYNLVLDTTVPKINSLNFTSVTGSGSNSVETAAYFNSTENKYYVNPTAPEGTTKSFTFNGTVTDNYGLEKICLYKNTATAANLIDSQDYTSAVAEFTFDNINMSMSTWGSSPTAIITATDKAGNTFSKTLSIVFDTTPPSSTHMIDDSGKDLAFRIGAYANDAGEPDVGGKYSNGTYGNALSIQIRGKFTDNDGGSGISKYYYKVFNNEEVVVGSGSEAGKVYFATEQALIEAIISHNQTNNSEYMFYPLTTAEPKNVEYNIGKAYGDTFTSADLPVTSVTDRFGGTPTTAVSGGNYTVNENGYVQFRTSVASNYKTTIKGFQEGKNYLVLVAEDNAGNRNVDAATIDGSTYYCYSLNVDITAPTIPTKQEGTIFTNLADGAAVNISGTVSDKPTAENGSSGLKNIVFTRDGGTGSVTVKSENFTPPTAADLAAVPEGFTSDTTLKHWTANVSSILPSSGTAIISAKVTDKAGFETSIPVATIIVDTQAPTVTINSPAANAKVGQSFTLSGTVVDEGGAGLDTTKKMVLQYTKAETISDTTVWTQLAEIDAAETWSYNATISDTLAPDGYNTPIHFRVSATDKSGSGNTGYSAARTITIDRKEPEYDSSEAIVGGKAHTLVSGSWFKDSTLNIIGKFTDTDGSGVNTIKYKVGTGTVQSVPTTDGTYNTNVSGFTSGSNTLYIWAVDTAGNEMLEANRISYTVQLDSNPPTISPANLGENQNYPFSRIYLTNGTTPVSFKFYVTEPESESGIDYDEDNGIPADSVITLKIGNTEITPGNGADDSEITIGNPDATGKRLVAVTVRSNDLTSVNGYETMLATVTDKAGNVSTPQAVGIINKDSDPPTLSFTSPDVNTEVNKTITVTGKASDANDVSEITLVATCGTNTKTYTKTSADAAARIDLENGIWTATINTLELDPSFSATGNDLTLSLTAKDEAGNETTAANAVTRILKINQSSDRPIVTIGSGVDFNQKNGNEIWVKGSATIYGSVIDDDGIATGGFKILRKAAGAADSTFIDASASYSGGSWNVTLPEDGSYVLKFEVKDKANTTFTSAVITATSTDAEILATPVLQDSDQVNKLGDTKATGNTLVPVCLDTNPPLLTITGISTDGSHWYEDVNASEINLGGIYHTLYVKAEASDTSGLYGDTDISGISASFNGSMTKAGSAYSCTSTASNYTVTKTAATDKNEFIITITGFDTGKNTANETVPFSGTLTFTITAKDKAGLETPKNFSRTVDNSAPVIKINAPEATITSTAVVTGSIEGETVNPTLYYTVKQNNTQPDVNDVSWTEESHAALTYNVYFDGNTSSTTTHAPLFKNYLWDLGITSEADVIEGTYNEFTTLYVWIKAKDNCGNISYKSAPVVVDPQGNRPTVTISYPDNNTTLGGTIRVMGTANDNIEAKFAWIQIDMGGNGAGWDTGDYAILNAVTKSDGSPYYTFGKISTNQTLDEAGITSPDSSNISDIAIMVPVSGGSWYQNINTANELIPSGTSNNVTISVYATDNDDGSSILKSNVARRTITVDKDAPFFVQSSLKLVRYNAAGSVTAEQAYKEGMSVKGVWWLEGQIKDESSGISTITVTEGAEGTGDQLALIDSATAELTNGDYQFRKVAGTAPNGDPIYNYNFKIKVGAESGVGGLEFNISAQENKTLGALSTNKSFIVRYDNQPPTLAAHNAEVFNINTTVKNSLGYYQLGSAAYERNSGDTGVERVAVYFTRTLDGVTYVYDPMYKRSVEASRLETGTALVKDAGDNLYWGSASASSITSDTLTLSAAPASYVHAGGLAKIKGVVYRINSISGNSVVLSGEPGDASSATDVYFAVANVVDNTSQESKGTPNSAYNASTGFGYGYCNNYTYDDGDKIMENFHKDDSTSWTWELWVNSKNIPDGDIAIHYVAFDKAGNSAYDHVDNAVVENNKPRLVSVKVGLDVNQDGNISDNAIESHYYYPEGMSSKPESYSEGTDTINISGITVKGLMQVIPEVVGGNGDLFYRWKTKKTTSWQTVAARLMQGCDNYDDGNFSDTDDYISGGVLSTNTGTIEHNTEWLISNSENNCTDFSINYEIADSTQGRTKFAEGASASNKLCINITNINLLVRDEEEPDVVIDSMYWNSLTDNSVYNQEGHIELPSDLPSENFNVENTATSGEFDNDPKVSGKVKLTGKISDNKVLTEVYITLPGMSGISTSTKVAVYNKTEGKWKNAAGSADFTTVGSLATEGYEFTILQNTNSFDVNHGHSVDWSLIWDSSKITNCAATDVNFQVLAYDDASHAGNTVNRSSSYTYKMDVVPYITNIETALSKLKSNNPSVYARTALGHYTVASTETIKISGFNLTGGTVKISSPNGNTEIAYDPDGISVASAKSGKLSVIVHDIESLNNKNDNDGHGDYAGTTTNPTGDKTIYSNYYNRQPNGDNNNLLTDDVVVDIWEIDSEAVLPMRKKGSIAQAVMKINPVTGQLGFAFANAAAYFSMPGKTVEAARDNSTAAWNDKNVKAFSPLRDYSYTYWNAELEPFTSIGFAYDKYGYSYGVASGGDINSGSKESLDFFSFMTDRWGKALGDASGNDGGYGRHNSSKHDQNAVRIETNGLRENGAAVFEPQRIKSPSIVAAAHGDSDESADTNVYLAYYDVLTSQIRFRTGNIGTKLTGVSSNNYDTTKYYKLTKLEKSNTTGLSFYYINDNPYWNLSDGNRVKIWKEIEGGNKVLVEDYEDKEFIIYNLNTIDKKFALLLSDSTSTTEPLPLYDSSTSTKLKEGTYYIQAVPEKSKGFFGNFVNTYGNETKLTNTNFANAASSEANFGKIAEGTTAGEYVSMAVIPKGSTGGQSTDDVVVVVWYGDDMKLHYAYNTTPSTIRGNGSTDGWTSTTLFTGNLEQAGEYCQVAVDANGGIHIAGLDSANSDLVYAYIAKFNEPDKVKTCMVDSNGIVGDNLTIDVALDDAGNAIPRISYYNSSTKRPKLAYLADATTANPDGAKEDMFTGKWESTIVPTSSKIDLSNAGNKINVAVWKDSNGVIKNSTPITKLQSTDHVNNCYSTSYGILGGNGSANAVLGYIVKKDSTTNAIETAQMK